MNRLPPSLRRRSVRSLHAREEAMLDNFKLSRDLTDLAYRGPGVQPSLADYTDAATELGFDVRSMPGTAGNAIGIYRDDVLLVVLVQDGAGDVVLCPTEERP